jgi:rhodanese-related sulfurtransferase
MMTNILLAIMIFFLGVLGGLRTVVLSADVPRITKEELKAMLGDPDLVILDVRLGPDYISSDLKIKAAVREDYHMFYQYPKHKTLVLYCASPGEGMSAPMAQKIIDKGFTKVYVLKGGWQEWLNAQYPTEKK